MKGDEMKAKPKGPCYKIQLWHSGRVNGYLEKLVIAEFYPTEINGFGKPINARNERKDQRCLK